MASAKDNAAATADHMDALTAREGKRLAAFDKQRKEQTRTRRGLNTAERRRIIESLRSGVKWAEIERRFKNVVADETLEEERPGLEAAAAAEDQPVLPPKPQG